MGFDDDTNEAHERRITRCQAPSCRAKIIFLDTADGKKMPVDADTVEPDDDEYDSERHESHFATCKDANAFRRQK